jgi:ATP-dependent protease Clp ATPase subunit
VSDDPKTEIPKLKRSCSMCLKDEDCVAILIAGPHNIFICDECIHLASLIIGKAFHDKAKRAEEDAAFVEAGQQLLHDAIEKVPIA